MSYISKSFTIAIVATLIIGLPVFIIDLQFTAIQMIIATFLISLASTMAATTTNRARTHTNTDDKRSSFNNSRRESGNVKWFNASKGFGFITRDSGDDIFVHFRSIRGEGHRVLHDGQRVEFAISEGDKGLQAEDVAAT